jgi:NADH:ubiquinone oxidoreductase subunit D
MRTSEETLDAEERYHLERVHELRLAYEAAAKPYVDRLVYLRSIRPQVPFVITVEQAHGIPHPQVPRA